MFVLLQLITIAEEREGEKTAYSRINNEQRKILIDVITKIHRLARTFRIYVGMFGNDQPRDSSII